MLVQSQAAARTLRRTKQAAAAAGEAVSNAPREEYAATLRTRVRRCAREPWARDLRDSEGEEEESEADVNGGRSSYVGTAGTGARVEAASEGGGSQKASLTEIHAPEGGMVRG